ncbi:unnamed protein product, partial [Prorocentrum cordatum]
ATGPLMDKSEQRFNHQIRRLQQQVHHLDKRLAATEQRAAAIEERLSHAGKELDLARARPRDAPIISSDRDRVVDHTIMLIRAPELVPKSTAAPSITEWLEVSNFQLGSEVVLIGDEISKQFAVLFQAHIALRIGSGRWRQFAADLPAKTAPLCASVGKNRKEIATEMTCKKLQRALLDARGIDTFVGREGWQLLAKWGPLAKITPSPPSCSTGDIGLGRGAAQELARNAFNDGEIQWSGQR